MIAEIYHSSFYVFVCDFNLEISSFFDKCFSFLSQIIVYLYLGAFLCTWSLLLNVIVKRKPGKVK